MHLFKKNIILPASLMLLCGGCFKDKAELLYPAGGCSTDSVTYSGTVNAILAQNCARSGCHDAATAMSGVNLSSVAGAQIIAKDGRLLGTINHAAGYSPMPKDAAKLDDCRISQISKWIADGAPDN